MTGYRSRASAATAGPLGCGTGAGWKTGAVSDVHDLMRAAESTKVAVIGGGIAGLVAAYDCAKLGMPVEVFDAGREPGGAIRTVDLGGVRVDAGATMFARGGATDALVDQLIASGASLERTERRSGPRTTVLAKGGIVPLPAGILGIPANPFLTEVVRIVGWGGAWRGYLDRLRPPLTIGHESDLGKLVTSRLGAKFADRLVAPVTRSAFGLLPDEVDVEVAAPALNAALTRTGSLTGGAGELLDEDAAPAVVTLRGGMGALVDELVTRIEELGGVIHRGATVTGLAQVDDGWQVMTDAPVTEADASDDRPVDAELVIVATDEMNARTLLGSIVSIPRSPARTAGERLVTMLAVVDAPAAADAPWGSGISPQPGPSQIEALDDLTSAWGVDADGQRVVRARVRLTGTDVPSEAARTAITTEAERLLGTRVVLSHLESFVAPPHAEQRGFTAWAAHVAPRGTWPESLDAAGAWLVGADLDAVVAAARAAGERVRRAALFT